MDGTRAIIVFAYSLDKAQQINWRLIKTFEDLYFSSTSPTTTATITRPTDTLFFFHGLLCSNSKTSKSLHSVTKRDILNISDGLFFWRKGQECTQLFVTVALCQFDHLTIAAISRCEDSQYVS